MATKDTKAKPAAKKAPAPAPKPGVDPRESGPAEKKALAADDAPQLTEEEQREARVRAAQDGDVQAAASLLTDEQLAAAGEELQRRQTGTGIAAPPTPTVEHALTANDAPGAGDSLGTGAAPARRRLADEPDEDLVDVVVPAGFRLNHNGEHEYQPGAQKMPRAHAAHWYAKAQGVRLAD